MPKLTRKLPKITHHQASGQARVRHRGRDYYLGPYGSPQSHEAYGRLIARLSAGQGPGGDERPQDPPAVNLLSVAELIERFWAHTKVYYRRDGEPTGEHITIRAALRPVLKMFGALPVVEFTPKRLKLVREEMIRMEWSRRYINASVRRIRLMFSWAVEEELIPAEIAGALATVKALREGRSEAREKPEVEAVSDDVVEATLPHVSAVVADVIRVMRLSGARPSEALGMRVEAIDRTDSECWRYFPPRHKTSHRGKTRIVYLGPRCQAILTPWIVKAGSGKVLPLTLSGLRTAITRGCRRAGIKPHWAPNQLRHSAATEIRKRFGVEASQVMLGHAHINTTEIYAEVDADRGREVARLVG